MSPVTSLRFVSGAAWFAAAMLCVPVTSLAEDPVDVERLSIVAFNVLAPVWASPVWYPDELDPDLLERSYRRKRVTTFLTDIRDRTDVVCLQEVEAEELPFVVAALGADFEGAMAFNEPDFWSNWVVPGIPWAPNGVALFVRTSAITDLTFLDLPVSADGNHMMTLSARHAVTGRRLRIHSVHLDSDSNRNRLRELGELMKHAPADASTIDIVCGDINEDTMIGSAAKVFERNGYVDVLAAIGNREATHPFSSKYNRSPRWAVIDHVLVRNCVPVSGDVFDFGVWTISDEVARIEENLRRSGSDHFPIGATIALPPGSTPE